MGDLGWLTDPFAKSAPCYRTSRSTRSLAPVAYTKSTALSKNTSSPLVNTTRSLYISVSPPQFTLYHRFFRSPSVSSRTPSPLTQKMFPLKSRSIPVKTIHHRQPPMSAQPANLSHHLNHSFNVLASVSSTTRSLRPQSIPRTISLVWSVSVGDSDLASFQRTNKVRETMAEISQLFSRIYLVKSSHPVNSPHCQHRSHCFYSTPSLE